MAQTKTKSETKSKSKAKSKAKASSSKNKAGQQSSRARPKKPRQLEEIEQIRGTTAAQTHPIEPTQLKFRWIPAGQTERPGYGDRCGPACGGRGSRGDPWRNGHGRRRKLVKSLKRIDLPSADAAIDWVEKESYGCWRRRRQGRADDVDRA